MSNQATIVGTVYFASEAAQHSRHYRQGRSIRTNSYVSAHYLAEDFVQLDLDSTGRNYVHVSLT